MISMRDFALGKMPNLDAVRPEGIRDASGLPALSLSIPDEPTDSDDEHEAAPNEDIKRRRLIPCVIPLNDVQIQNHEQETEMDWTDLILQQVKRANALHETNQIFSDDALKLLESQGYCCASCGQELDTITRTQKRRAWNKASLDRIDVFAAGYGNGNAQWLCVHCNLGKNSTDNSVHKAKMYSRAAALEDSVQEVKRENDQLKQMVEGLKVKLTSAYKEIDQFRKQ